MADDDDDAKSSWLSNAFGFAADKVQSAVQSVGDTVSSGASELGQVADSAVQAAASGASSVTDAVENGASAVGQAADSAVQAVASGASSVADTVENGVSAIGQTIAETGASVAAGVGEMAVDAASGAADLAANLYQKAKDFAGEVVKTAEDPYQYGGVQAPIVKTLEDIAADGHPVDARPLSPAEMADARAIFGDSLDYSKIMVDGGAVASLGASRTLGNTVHLTSDLFQEGSTETTTEGKRTLVHELTHVWQYQHQGWTYAPKALWAQAKAAAHGDRDGAYEWRPLVGTPWEQWNPEAQAEVVEDYNRALHKVEDGTATRDDYDTLALARPYVEMLQTAPSA